MTDDWTDPEFAARWDAAPISQNPVREEQLDILLSILEDEYRPGACILDVGIGSGLVEELIFRRIPAARVVGVDSSRAMLALARRRLGRYAGRYEIVEHDLRDVRSLELPERNYQVAISIQTLHNLPPAHNREAMRFVWKTLEPGGLFLLLDRIAVDRPGLYSCYRSLWRRQEKVYGAPVSAQETFEEHAEAVRSKGDLPVGLEQNLAWLSEAGFKAACLHLHADRALLGARKPFTASRPPGAPPA